MLLTHPSYIDNVFNILNADTDNAVLDSGSMYHLAAADVQTDVVGLAVMVMVNEDNISDLHAAKANFPAVRTLHVGTVRQSDAIVSTVAVHCKTGTVETGRRCAAGHILASDKASDEAAKTAAPGTSAL